MDDPDATRTGGPFDETLTPAVRPVEDAPGAEESPEEAATTDVEALVGPRRTLEARVQAVWILQSAVTATVFGLIAAVGFGVLLDAAWVGGVVFAAFFLIGAVFAVLRYRVWWYEVREDSLYLRRGVLTRVKTVAPYVRIQHVDTRRGPLERTFGLSTVVVYTAGSRGADVSIPGLTPERGEDLQARLKQLAIAAEGEDAV